MMASARVGHSMPGYRARTSAIGADEIAQSRTGRTVFCEGPRVITAPSTA